MRSGIGSAWAGGCGVLLMLASAAGAAAGADAVPTDTRWIAGEGVLLRASVAADAPVRARFALNAQVRLLAVVGDRCEVQAPAGTRGFVACAYLDDTAVDLDHLSARTDALGKPNPDYDPLRAFRIDPSLQRLLSYAYDLEAAAGDDASHPRDDVLEAMKAELARGSYGPAPTPLPDWSTLRRRATALAPVRYAPMADTALADRLRASDLADTLGIWGDAFYAREGEAFRIAGFVLALQLPTVRPSWFADESALAPPGDPEIVGARFGIVHRTLIAKRPAPTADRWVDGLYDMHSATRLLVRPVPRVRLFRDGALQVESSHVRQTQFLGDSHEECMDWTRGFAWGDTGLDNAAWRYDAAYGVDPRAEHDRSGKAADSLYEFHVQAALPQSRATVSLREQAMDPATTGFVRGTYLVFDLDHDAVPDLLVWEGTGRGPGHMDDGTETDDTWYRLVLANVAGRWKVLGSDQFSYGCGC